VLLLWQEFSTRSVAVFFLTCHRGAGAGSGGDQYGVKATIVYRKQVDVVASRLAALIVPAVMEWLTAHCTRRARP